MIYKNRDMYLNILKTYIFFFKLKFSLGYREQLMMPVVLVLKSFGKFAICVMPIAPALCIEVHE